VSFFFYFFGMVRYIRDRIDVLPLLGTLVKEFYETYEPPNLHPATPSCAPCVCLWIRDRNIFSMSHPRPPP
jgi:hypothetical protein